VIKRKFVVVVVLIISSKLASDFKASSSAFLEQVFFGNFGVNFKKSKSVQHIKRSVIVTAHKKNGSTSHP